MTTPAGASTIVPTVGRDLMVVALTVAVVLGPMTAGSSVVRQKWSYFQMGRIGVLSLETIPRGLKPHTFLAACGTAKAVPFQNE